MSRVKTRLITELNAKFGIDSSKAVDYLYEHGMLDDCRVRMHVVREEVVHRFVSTQMNTSQIHEEVGMEFGLTRERVSQISPV